MDYDDCPPRVTIMNRLIPATGAALVYLLSFAAGAQVIRCVEPKTGAVTYTDGKCSGTQRGAEVVPQSTPDQIRQERAQSQEALRRNQQEQAAIAAREAANAARTRYAEQADTNQADKSQSAECKRALSNLDVVQRSITNKNGVPGARAIVNVECGTNINIDGNSRRARSHDPMSMPMQPSVITSCDAGGCWDNMGGRYNRSGKAFFGPGGKACQQIGSMMQCP